jgi:hypothetical protein
MRGIRELAPAANISTAPPSTRTWNPTRGFLFGLGALSILIGSVIFGFQFPAYRHAASFKPSVQDLDQTLAMIDQSSPEDLWKMWHEAAKHGMGEHSASFFVFARSETRRLRRHLTTAGVLVGIGLTLVTVPLLLPSHRDRKAQRQS